MGGRVLNIYCVHNCAHICCVKVRWKFYKNVKTGKSTIYHEQVSQKSPSLAHDLAV